MEQHVEKKWKVSQVLSVSDKIDVTESVKLEL